MLGLWLVAVSVNGADASLPAAAEEEKIPALKPPRGLIPPGVWEQYGAWFVAGGLVLLLLVSAGVWWCLRPRPPVFIPPEARARRALEPLRREPETGAVLSRVSQVVRSYFGTVFGLPPGELTTSEFCRSLSASQEPGPDLVREVSAFLRECDERKFAPRPPMPPMGAVAQADKLIADAESRRAQATAMVSGGQAGGPGGPPEPAPAVGARSTP